MLRKLMKQTKKLFGEFLGGLAVKDLASLLLGLWFDPWPRNFHMLWLCTPPPKYIEPKILKKTIMLHLKVMLKI